MDTYVERTDLAVLRVKADMKGRGPPTAFAELESKLPTLRGRHFYGSFLIQGGEEEYFACVERTPSDDPVGWGLGEGVLPGGWYVRRKLAGGDANIPEFPRHFRELTAQNDPDPARPSLEFYRSERELHLLLPVLHRTGADRARRPALGERL